MAITHNFDETIEARADRDPEFRKAIADEAADCLREGDFETAKEIYEYCKYSASAVGFMTEHYTKDIGVVLHGAAALAASRGIARLQADILLLAEAVLDGLYNPDAAEDQPAQKPPASRSSVTP